MLVDESRNYNVHGDKELTHESQLVSIAQNINIQANERGYAGAYAEFKSNLKDSKEFTAAAIAGIKF